jgi:hypothetical protein
MPSDVKWHTHRQWRPFWELVSPSPPSLSLSASYIPVCDLLLIFCPMWKMLPLVRSFDKCAFIRTFFSSSLTEQLNCPPAAENQRRRESVCFAHRPPERRCSRSSLHLQPGPWSSTSDFLDPRSSSSSASGCYCRRRQRWQRRNADKSHTW